MKKSTRNVVKGFGDRVRATRTRLGLSQAALAKQARLRQNTVSQIESGVRAASLDVAARLARALGVSLDSLLPSKSRHRAKVSP